VPPSEGPVINVAPGDNAAGGTGQPSPGESGTSGTPQTYNPNTGGGASQVPLWLGLLSALMVLGGWRLRRVSRPAHAPVRSDEGKE
jgi:LPXTG-motif cell wall-anchored protein